MAKTTSEKLVELLEQCGFSDVSIHPARGHYRTSKYADVYRWEGFAKKNGADVTICSWETMTECVQHGIIIGAGDGGSSSYLVHRLSSQSLRTA